MRGYPHFSLWIPITLDKIYFFPIVITFAKFPRTQLTLFDVQNVGNCITEDLNFLGSMPPAPLDKTYLDRGGAH